MDLRVISTNNFKGYDARHLHGFIMGQNPHGIASEMMSIGKKENFKLLLLSRDKTHFTDKIDFQKSSDINSELWAQDIWTIAKGKLFSLDFNKQADFIRESFGLKKDLTQIVMRNQADYKNAMAELYKISPLYKEDPECFSKLYADLYNKRHDTHIPGGNMYLVKIAEDKEGLLVGRDELKKFTKDEIQTMYGASRLTSLPQMDYHVDLFIRPLDNKRILLADDNLTIKCMQNMLDKLIEYKKNLTFFKKFKYKMVERNLRFKINEFNHEIKKNNLPQTEEVEKILEKSGYKVIRVPGRIYNCEFDCDRNITLHHDCNYINAHTFKNKNNKLVYITNKSDFDREIGLTEKAVKEIGISFEKEFINSISSYIKPEHIYFIEGENGFVQNEMLPKYLGGIHCAAAEIPETVIN